MLLGQSQGPRFGSFAAIFGIDRTIALIDEKLKTSPILAKSPLIPAKAGTQTARPHFTD